MSAALSFNPRRLTRVASIRLHVKVHLAGALNGIGFDDWTWEAKWTAQSSFYTNRLRISEINEFVKTAGLEPEVTKVQCWDARPTLRAQLAARFNDERR